MLITYLHYIEKTEKKDTQMKTLEWGLKSKNYINKVYMLY